MRTIIIADNLVNDYCSIEPRFLQCPVNIGKTEADRLFSADSKWGQGPLVAFLTEQIKKPETTTLFVRDLLDPSDPKHNRLINQLGEHCLVNTPGVDFPEILADIVHESHVMDCAELVLQFDPLRDYLLEELQLDLFSNDIKDEVQFLIVGFHTERRILNTAILLRNIFGFEVAVFSHFVASSNREFHFNTLRYQLTNNQVQVFYEIEELGNFLGEDLSYLSKFNLSAVSICPEDIKELLHSSQRKIIESICMHWSEAHLKALGGGFSGSALFLAHGKQGLSKTEPMVIKIDNHHPIQQEIRGYNHVKDFLGKHVPTFTFPVIDEDFMGVGMELAAMEGPPATLQDHFEKVQNDYALDNFLGLLDRTLDMLKDRLYQNTYVRKPLAPFRHYMLHISQQSDWLAANMRNMERHPTDRVMISAEVLVNIFNLIRNNGDAIFSDVCIGHGDLNLANIIVDDHGNLWTIDWTHTGQHPLATDFAKMENDVKFVLSKEIDFDDLTKLQVLEEYLLQSLVPPSTDVLPEHLHFIKWDLRFKKIYKTIQKIREAYASLKKDDSWFVYKIALLRYSLHTLSFDKTIDAGECSPSQLWYTVISTEDLLFDLMADDYHLKIRSERPAYYPERQRIPLDLTNWEIECPDYVPPYFVTEEVLSNDRSKNPDGLADPEDKWHFEDFIDWGRPYPLDLTGKPLNPNGRTGIAGRGALYLWGQNPALYLLPVRFDDQLDRLEILLEDGDDTVGFPSIDLTRNEPVQDALQRLLLKLPFKPEGMTTTEIHEGYLYDLRQTDNAWIEGKGYLLFLDSERSLESRDGDGTLNWKVLEPGLINDLYSNQAQVLRKALEFINDNILSGKEFLKRLLDRTG